MAYATLAQFRSVTNFTKSDILDAEVTALIADADRAIVRLTTTEQYLERLYGNIDGTNVDFKTRFNPIADADASGTVDGDDVSIFYATFDAVTNYRELGSAQTVVSIQAKEGIITMDTAPTTTTAEAGVFAIYRYDARGDTSIDIYKLAACQMLGYLVAKKLRGVVVEQFSIDKDVRQQKTDTDWLGLVYETLALQDKLFLDAPKGFGIPQMNVDGSSNNAYCSAKRGSYCGNYFGGYY